MEAVDYREKPVCELTPHEVGRLGEEIVATFLESRGYQIVDRNWRSAYGEADIVCRDGDEYALVEVKTRTLPAGCESTVYPELAVDSEKLTRYARMRLAYQALFEAAPEVRLDVAAVTLDECEPRAAHVRYLRGICLGEAL